MNNNQEIERLHEKITSAETSIRIEKLIIDGAIARLKELGSIYTTKEAFVRLNNPNKTCETAYFLKTRK